MNDQIFPSNLALEALKSGPYKNTAYAISELIDNSADAKATEIGVVAFVEREGAQPHTIAVLDNGCGMDKTLLSIVFNTDTGISQTQARLEVAVLAATALKGVRKAGSGNSVLVWLPHLALNVLILRSYLGKVESRSCGGTSHPSGCRYQWKTSA